MARSRRSAWFPFHFCSRTGRRGFVLERIWVEISREGVGLRVLRCLGNDWLAKTDAPGVVPETLRWLDGKALCCDGTFVSG